MLDLREFRVLDRNSEFYGTPVSVLMDNAGRRVAESVLRNSEGRRNAVIVCGPGNNGGDGFAAAFHLRGKMAVTVILSTPGQSARSELLKSRFELISDIVRGREVIDTFKPKDVVVVDALLGSGLKGPPEGDFLSLIVLMDRMHSLGSKVISVDVPSGFPTQVHVHPDITVTFHDSKDGMNELNSGRIEIADIGIPDRALKFTGPGEMVLYPVPGRESHKGNNGVVTVIGGGGFAGAPTFSSMAAYRTGADLVYTIVPGRSYNAVSCFSPNLMPFRTAGDNFSPADVTTAMEWVQKSGAFVIGPGMNTDDASSSFIERVLEAAPRAAVVDAAAIEVAGRKLSIIEGRRVVVTPHAKEFEKLTGESISGELAGRADQISSWARELGVTILLKGATDIISDGNRTKFNETGNPGMTVGGTGDVLTGIVAALLSKGCSPFDAARLGAFINGSAGDVCFLTRSFGLLATDVIESIPEVLVRYLRD